MAATVRSLVVNVTVTNTWIQMTDEDTGSAYALPAAGRADLRSLMAYNLGVNDAEVDFAFSVDGSISDVERGFPTAVLGTKEYALWDSIQGIPQNKAVWVRAIGTSPNVTFKATLFEVT